MQRSQSDQDKLRENNEHRQSSSTYRWYHVMIKIKNDSKEITSESRDLNEINLKRGITIPYSQGQNFFLMGRSLIHLKLLVLELSLPRHLQKIGHLLFHLKIYWRKVRM